MLVNISKHNFLYIKNSEIVLKSFVKIKNKLLEINSQTINNKSISIGTYERNHVKN